MDELIKSSLFRLFEYIEKENLRGYDPFDALNSPIINQLTGSSKWLKIAFTQLFRRMPFNLRPVFGISKDYNP